MKIPDDAAQRAIVMAKYVAEVEAKGEKRAFRPEEWALAPGPGATLEEASLGSLLGCGGEYFFYQIDSGKVVTTVVGDGPWPYSTVAWLWGEVCPYEEALVRVALDIAQSGGWAPHEVRAMITKVMP